MYWTDWGANPKIERASQDGTQRQVLVSTGVEWPNGLTMDYESQRLWWTDGKLRRIESVKTDGTKRTLVMSSGIGLEHIFSVTNFEDVLYWDDWQTKSIYSANKFTGEDRKVFQSQLHFPMGLRIFHRLRQPTCKSGMKNAVALWNQKRKYEIKIWGIINSSNCCVMLRDTFPLRPFHPQCQLSISAIEFILIYEAHQWAETKLWSRFEQRTIDIEYLFFSDRNHKYSSRNCQRVQVTTFILWPFQNYHFIPSYESWLCHCFDALLHTGARRCPANNGCQFLCIPRADQVSSSSPSYVCECPTGIKLNPDNKTCNESECFYPSISNTERITPSLYMMSIKAPA